MEQLNKEGRGRLLLLGDDADAPWHPLAPARRELEAMLGNEWDMESTEEYGRLTSLADGAGQAACELFVSYTDCWNRDIPAEQAAGLLRYVAGGGGLLVIHNGISLQRSYELAQLMGGKFTGHPPYQPLMYHAAAGTDHPVMEGFRSFPLDEEPYLFELDPLTPRDVFLEFEFEGRRYPAGWSHRYGLGRVLYLQPGHHAPSFVPEPYRELIRRSARWAAGKL